MIVSSEAKNLVRRQIEVAEAWQDANNSNLLAKTATTQEERRQHYAKKGEAISKLVELDAVEVLMDGDQLSFVDPVRKWKLHLRWEQLTPGAKELIRQEVGI